MKRTKQCIAALLCMVLLAVPLGVTAAAAPLASGRLTVLSYNAAGLPLLSAARNPWKDSKRISAHFAAGDYDLIGVQEDFNCHRQLTGQFGDALPYGTVHQGLIPAGDGLGVFSKYPLYNQTNTRWEQSFGVFGGSADELTPKGFVHTVVCLTADPDGPKADFFTLHADAGRDADSVAAREANFRQLAAYINKNCAGRALIITGDFNTHYNVELERVPAAKLVTQLVPGLRDSWQECTQLGLPAGQPAAVREMPANGDSIDHVMVRDGGGITFEFVQAKNLNIQWADGKAAAAEGWLTEGDAQHSLSDHSARYAVLDWTYNAAQAHHYGELNKPAWSFALLGKQIQSFFHTLGLVLAEPFKLLWAELT